MEHKRYKYYIHSHVCSFKENLVSTFCVPDTVSSAGENRQDPCYHEAHMLMVETQRSQRNKHTRPCQRVTSAMKNLKMRHGVVGDALHREVLEAEYLEV